MNAFFILFPVLCAIFCYGLMRKAWWMWYVGWVFLYLCSGYFCLFFYGAMSEAETGLDLIFSFVCFIGGLVLWLPSVLWWIRVRPKFKRKSKKKNLLDHLMDPRNYPEG